MHTTRLEQKPRRIQQAIFVMLLAAVLFFSAAPELRANALLLITDGRSTLVLDDTAALREDQLLLLGGQAETGEPVLAAGKKAVIRYDGQEQYATTREGESVGALLQRAGITVGPLEMVCLDLSGEDVLIEIGSDFTYYETVAEPAAYTTVYETNYRIPKGETSLGRAGVDGTRDVTYEVVYADGQLVSRQAIAEGESTAVPELIYTGTLVQEAARGDTIAEVITEEDGSGYLILSSGDSLHFSGTRSVTCTAYTTGYDGVGTITYTGTRVHVGSMAVDKSVIPLGTRMFVVGSTGYSYGYGVAEDTGVKGEWIDLFMDTYYECRQFGLQRNSTAYILD